MNPLTRTYTGKFPESRAQLVRRVLSHNAHTLGRRVLPCCSARPVVFAVRTREGTA